MVIVVTVLGVAVTAGVAIARVVTVVIIAAIVVVRKVTVLVAVTVVVIILVRVVVIVVAVIVIVLTALKGEASHHFPNIQNLDCLSSQLSESSTVRMSFFLFCLLHFLIHHPPTYPSIHPSLPYPSTLLLSVFAVKIFLG